MWDVNRVNDVINNISSIFQLDHDKQCDKPQAPDATQYNLAKQDRPAAKNSTVTAQEVPESAG